LRILSAIALSLLLGSCSPPPSLLQRILAQGELRVVTQNSPTTFYYGIDEARGVEFELAQRYAARLGVRLRIYTADQFRELFSDVSQGRAEIGAAGLTVTDPRRSLVTFGPSYQNVESQVIYRMGTKKPRSLAGLLGGKLEILAGSSHANLLEQARGRIPYLTWNEKPDLTTESLVRRVASGEIDYAIVKSNEFSLLQHYYPEARVAFGLGNVSRVAWALPQGAKDLRESVASYFAEIEATGELQQILDRYYYESGNFDYVGSRAFVRHLDSRFPQLRDLFVEAQIETGVDWKLLAAMAYQESHWNPQAVSPTGVRGVMMLTERTAQMMNVADRNDARQSIIGGARYFKRVLKKLPERIPPQDRLWLAVAAYNIGFGHVEDARIITQMRGGNPDSWEDVRNNLPLLSDEHWFKRVQRGYARGDVPVIYVDNVRRYFSMLEWMGGMETLSEQLRLATDKEPSRG
jgi:peptidoglycan lytic transglycosylase F